MLRDLRALGWLATTVEDPVLAARLVRRSAFPLAVFVVEDATEWLLCGELAGSARGSVAVVSPFLSRDRRYREFAFATGVAAYVHRPYRRLALHQTLLRLRRGERRVEVAHDAASAIRRQGD